MNGHDKGRLNKFGAGILESNMPTLRAIKGLFALSQLANVCCLKLEMRNAQTRDAK